MITLPPVSTNGDIRLLSIDPGSDNMGLSLFTLNPRDGRITSLQATTYTSRKLNMDKNIELAHGERVSRIMAHRENLKRIFSETDPLEVVCESPFFTMRRPSAYGALSELLSLIRTTLIEHYPSVPFIIVDPPTVKKAVGAKGNGDKDVVRKAVLALTDLNYSGITKLEELDEHSIDSIAVGYWRVKQIQKELEDDPK